VHLGDKKKEFLRLRISFLSSLLDCVLWLVATFYLFSLLLELRIPKVVWVILVVFVP